MSQLLMQCPLLGHSKAHKHGKMPKALQRYRCPICQQTFTKRFDTCYYRRQITAKTIQQVL